MEVVESTCEILDLPDLALYHICTYISCPFDLLHFGNTCTRLRNITSSPLLWHSLSFKCLHGLWVQLEEGSVEENPREWLLDVIRQLISKKINTKTNCIFPNGEEWIRGDTPKIRFLVRLLQLSYSTEKDPHPAVLHEQWLYDIGIFKRCNTVMDFPTFLRNMDNLPIAEELSNLSQAAERDLRLRKQPFKDKRYYIKFAGLAVEEEIVNLFPFSENEPLCPLLLVPSEPPKDTLGLIPLLPCLGKILVKHLSKHYKLLSIHMMTLWEIIKVFSSFLVEMVTREHQQRTQPCTLKEVLLTIFDDNPYNTGLFDDMTNYFHLQIPYREVVVEFCGLLNGNESKTLGIEVIRSSLRKQLLNEVKFTLFPPESSNNHAARLNLTDSDLIGGDNGHQEMSCAALISNYGVLVIWQLVGRSRY